MNSQNVGCFDVLNSKEMRLAFLAGAGLQVSEIMFLSGFWISQVNKTSVTLRQNNKSILFNVQKMENQTSTVRGQIF